MARLSEPPPESVESLTRRFVRQNRDLTRTNATQSIKIRTLENQVSALLTENLSLRETVIQLRGELGDGGKNDVVKNVMAVQRQLDAKLQEINGLVKELGLIENKAKRRKSQMHASGSSPRGRVLREKPTLMDLGTVREGQLPTIYEDKHFPRKTLDSTELAALAIQGSSESPELGPPPMISFVHEDITSTEQDHTTSSAANDSGDAGIPVILSANFETRRRRRETYVRSDDRTDKSESNTELDSSISPENMPNRPMRAGAKRKLDSQDRSISDTQTQFEFVRKRTASEDAIKSDLGDTAPLTNVSDMSSHVVLRPIPKSDGLESPKRKALTTKSVNMSPRKTIVAEQSKDEYAQKPTKKPDGDQEDHRQENQSEHFMALHEQNIRDDPPKQVEIKLEPSTPAAPFDLVSPVSTQPSDCSTHRPASPRPPSGHLGAATNRPSRRARAAVSYAEPNLVSKMRRPTKELADAVAPEGRQRTSCSVTVDTTSIKPEEDSEATDHPSSSVPMRTVLLNKIEPTSREWRPADSSLNKALPHKPEPKSPLSSRNIATKASLEERASDRITSRDRRRSNFHVRDALSERTASSAAIGTLISSTHREDKLDPAQPVEQPEQSLQEAMQALDIYDVQDSPKTSSLSPSNSSDTPPERTEDGIQSSLKTINHLKPQHKDPAKSTRPTFSTSSSSSTITTTTRPDLPRSSSTSSIPPRSRPSSTTSDIRPSSRRQTLGSGHTNHGTGSTLSTSSTRPGSVASGGKAVESLSRAHSISREPKPGGDSKTGGDGKSYSTNGVAGTAGFSKAAEAPLARGVEAQSSGRGERTANRRRSMMV